MRLEDFSLNNLGDVLRLGAQMHAEGAYSTVEFDVAVTAHCVFEMVIKSPDGFGLIAYAGETPVAMLAGGISTYFFSRKRKAFDHVWFVIPEHRGKRTAVLLLRRFLEWARERGASEVFMGITTDIEPEKTGRLFEKLGFRPVGGNYRLDL